MTILWISFDDCGVFADFIKFIVICTVRSEKGLNEKVCQKSFLLIHGFGKCRLEVLHETMSVYLIVPERDWQAKHTTRAMKVSEKLYQMVRGHIMSFLQDNVITVGIVIQEDSTSLT